MPVRFTDQSLASLLASILTHNTLPDLGSGPRYSTFSSVAGPDEPPPAGRPVNPYSPQGRLQTQIARQGLEAEVWDRQLQALRAQQEQQRLNIAQQQLQAPSVRSMTQADYRAAHGAAMQSLYGKDWAAAAEDLRDTLSEPNLSESARQKIIENARANGWNVTVQSGGEPIEVTEGGLFGIGGTTRRVSPPPIVTVKPDDNAIRDHIRQQIANYQDLAGLPVGRTADSMQPINQRGFSGQAAPQQAEEARQKMPLLWDNSRPPPGWTPGGPQAPQINGALQQSSPVARQAAGITQAWKAQVEAANQNGMEFSPQQKVALQKTDEDERNIQADSGTNQGAKEEALLGVAQRRAQIIPTQKQVKPDEALAQISADHPSGIKYLKRDDGSFEAVMPPGKDARNDSKRLSFDTSMAAIQEWKALQDGGILPDAAKRIVEAMFNIRLPDEMREKFKSPSNVRQEHDMNMGVLDRQSNHNQQQQQQLEQQAAREQQLQAQQQAAEYRRAAGFEDTLTTGSTGEQHASPYPQQQQVPQQDMPQAEPPVKLDDRTDPFAPKKSAIPEFENLRPTGDTRLDGMLEQNKQIVEKLLPDDRVAIMNVIEINNALKNGEPSTAEMAQMYEKLGNVKAKLEQSINNGTLSHADAQAAYSALQAIQAHQALVKQRK